MDQHNQGGLGNAGDRRNVAQEIVTQPLVKRGVDSIHRIGQKQRVAVAECAYNGFCADIAVAAGPVLDDEGLAKPL
jgi:hypothetical protein